VRLAVEALRLAKEEARHVQDVGAHVGEDEVLQEIERGLVGEDVAAGHHIDARAEDLADLARVHDPFKARMSVCQRQFSWT